MDVAIKVVKDVIKWTMGKYITPGLIVVLHTYGKDMKFNPHLHCLLTEGGFKQDGTWTDIGVFPYKMLRKSWQYQLLTSLKAKMEKSEANSLFIDDLFKTYSNGFYVRAKDTINNKKNIISYIGRYIRHPAIAECRITNYDGKEVVFYYDDEDGRHYVTMSVDEFITALLRHLPAKQFKTIRYYGVYYRRKRKFFKGLLSCLVSINN